jgi:hypothetical protein
VRVEPGLGYVPLHEEGPGRGGLPEGAQLFPAVERLGLGDSEVDLLVL